MGRLIDPEKRDRAKQQRVERKARILEVARSIFSRLPFVEVTLDNIGQRASVDRGVASMYFRSKEELFLRVLREELADWYSALEVELDRIDGPLSQLDLAELLATSLARRPELTRFLSLEAVVFEQNLDAMEVFHLQRWRRDRMESIGAILEKRVDGLREGDAMRLLHRVQLLTAALRPAADPKGAASYEVGDPDFEIFAIDFETELKRFAVAMLKEGVRAQE
ncbi:MAG: TetR family transcriptional regulator [Acidobacteriota bacterium]|nr:TetR family transcriptional regulator [Acidobacteriota bacterium]